MIASFPLAIAGFALLAMAMLRHAAPAGLGHWSGRQRQALRAAGFALLALSFAAGVIGPDWRFGLVEWVGQLTLAAAVSAGTLTARAQWLPGVAGLALVASVALALLL